MRSFWMLVLAGSLLLNILAVWGFFTFVRYGGSPLGDLKRLVVRSGDAAPRALPYARANEELLRGIARGDAPSPRIVFLGASITQHWDFERELPHLTIVNRGVGGELASDLLARFQRDVIDLSPRAVVLKLCSINVRPGLEARTLEDAVNMMCDLALAHGIEPVLCTMVPVAKPDARIGDFDVAGRLMQFNDWIRGVAEDRGLRLVDLADAIADEKGLLPREFAADPIHPNADGYRILTGAVRPVLESLVAQTES